MRIKHLAMAGVAGLTAAAWLAAAPPPARAEAAAAADPNRLFADSTLVSGDRISVEVTGHGPDVLLVPGLSSSRTTWKRTAERLRGRYRLHLVQVAGFAGAPAGANGSGEVVIPTAEAIDAYIVSAKLAPVIYVGHSLGGTWGLYLAEHHPEHLKKLLMVDTLPFLGVLMAGPAATSDSLKPVVAQIKAAMSSGGQAQYEAGLKQTAAFMARSPEGAQEILTSGARSDRGAVATAYAEDTLLDLRPGLATIPTPVTLVYPFDAAMGRPLDQWDGLYVSQYAALKSARLVRVDDSRHFVMFDQPARFDAALDAFLGP